MSLVGQKRRYRGNKGGGRGGCIKKSVALGNASESSWGVPEGEEIMAKEEGGTRDEVPDKKTNHPLVL